MDDFTEKDLSTVSEIYSDICAQIPHHEHRMLWAMAMLIHEQRKLTALLAEKAVR